jgi:hypothetical protein
MSTNAFVFGGKPVPPGFKFGGLQQELEDAEVQSAQLELKLADALEQNRLLGSQRDKAVKAEAVARKALQQVRSSWTSSLPSATMADNSSIFNKVSELETELENVRAQKVKDDNTIEALEIDLQECKKTIRDKDSEIAKVEGLGEQNKRQVANIKLEYEKTTGYLKHDNERLQTENQKLERDVHYHNDRAAHSESMLNRAYAEQENLREAYNTELKAKHEIEAQKLDLQLRYDSLFEQWQEDQRTIEECQDQAEELKAFEASQREFERDLAGQQAQSAEKDRKIIVKDERIAELEDQLQRERHRNLSAADAAAEATVGAATSYDNEAPPSLSGFGESLADELSEEYHSDQHSNYEPYIEQQDEPVYLTVADLAPVAPAIEPLTLDHVSEHFSIAPQDVPLQSLAYQINENTSTSPILPASQPLTLDHVSEHFSIAPQDVPAPTFTISRVSEYMSVAPHDIPRQSLTVEHVSEYVSIAPMDNPPQSLVLDVSNTSTSPRQIPVEDLTLFMGDDTSIAPKDVPRQDLTTNDVSEYLSVAPKNAPIQNSTIDDVNEYLNIAPRDIPRQHLTTYFGENTSTLPKDVPAPSLATAIQAASVDTAPKNVPAPNLTTYFGENTSTLPKDAPAPSLTTDVHAASVDTTPRNLPAQNMTTYFKQSASTSPKDLPLQSLTTDAHAASEHTAPLAPMAPNLKTEIAHDTALDTAPVTPTTPVLTPGVVQLSALDYPPFAPVAQKLTTKIIQPSALNYAPTEPAAEAPIEARPTIATTSVSVQTTESSTQSIATRYIEVEKPQKIGFLQAILPAIAALLAFLCLWQYAQLESWETANDYNYSSSYDNRGAFGNGRYVFGIPVGMDVGGNWYTEQLARFMSMMITSVESWAGIEHVTAY